jgi:NAD+ synthase (glutamine-hydrolysing)
MRLLVAQLNYTVGALQENASKIIDAIQKAKAQGCQLALFSEMALCGYPPEDLLLLPTFLASIENELCRIAKATEGITAILGTVRANKAQGKRLYNTAAVVQNGKILGYQDKTLLPTYDVFTEHRYFEPATQVQVWDIAGEKVAITICEDIWQHADLLQYGNYHCDPVIELAAYQPQLMVNLSASPYSIDKGGVRLKVASAAATALGCPTVLCNQIGGNDSLIFDGNSLVLDQRGALVRQGASFKEERFVVDTHDLPSHTPLKQEPLEDLHSALVIGVRDYFKKQKFTKACVGLSGGVDSALVACIAIEALGRENLLGVIMPSRYSSEASRDDALELASNLGIQTKEIPIEGPFQAYLDLLTPFFEGRPSDATEENLQARVRGMILMALSNKLGYIVLSTGNKSENAVGYSTLYGDLCGGLAVISDVAKVQVYALAHWINSRRSVIPESILTKAPSAELRLNQKDSDSLPSYEVLDTVLQEYVENHRSAEEIAAMHTIDLATVNDLIRRIHLNEYKRRQSPPGLRVTEKAFSVGRRFPIVQGWVN